MEPGASPRRHSGPRPAHSQPTERKRPTDSIGGPSRNFEANGVLRNLLHITTASALEAAEADITRARLLQLAARPLPGSFDLAHLCAMHAFVFGDLYDWAGRTRTVNIAKHTPFCPAHNIVAYSENIFGVDEIRDQNYFDVQKEIRVGPAPKRSGTSGNAVISDGKYVSLSPCPKRGSKSNYVLDITLSVSRAQARKQRSQLEKFATAYQPEGLRAMGCSK